MELSKLKKILEDDYGWGNLDTDENRWFVDEILQDSIYAISEALTLTSVSKWVAVTEKLPLVDGFYLVYIDGLTEEKALFKNNEFHVRDETLMECEVTHWMYLPKPPCC